MPFVRRLAALGLAALAVAALSRKTGEPSDAISLAIPFGAAC